MNNMKNPLLTIAIPTYKRPKYLYQAIRSAVEQTDQTIPYEIIVVNNDSESDMADVKAAFAYAKDRIHFFRNERNIGMIGNVNRCVSLARGKYISFLHDDDILLPEYLAEIKPILKAGEISCLVPERYLLFEKEKPTDKFEIEERRKRKSKLLSLVFPRYLFRRKFTSITCEDNAFAWQNCYCAPTCGVVFQKETILKHKLFFPEGTYSWDFISFFALNEKEKVSILHKPVSVYRMTSGASLRAEVQFDFYMAFDDLMKKFPEHSKTGNFIKKHEQEIRYSNYALLNNAGKEYVKTLIQGLVTECPSGVKYKMFVVRRLLYFAMHNLDVEKPLTNEGRETLKRMGVI